MTRQELRASRPLAHARGPGAYAAPRGGRAKAARRVARRGVGRAAGRAAPRRRPRAGAGAGRAPRGVIQRARRGRARARFAAAHARLRRGAHGPGLARARIARRGAARARTYVECGELRGHWRGQLPAGQRHGQCHAYDRHGAVEKLLQLAHPPIWFAKPSGHAAAMAFVLPPVTFVGAAGVAVLRTSRAQEGRSQKVLGRAVRGGRLVDARNLGKCDWLVGPRDNCRNRKQESFIT